jgi:O-antigen/teichoic acid export membrane protein
MASSLYSRGFLDDLGRLYKDVSRWIFTGALAIFLLTVLLAKDIMALFGDEFISSWPVLIVVAGAELYNSSMGPQDRLLAMIGNHKIVVLATVGGAVAALVGSLALVPFYSVWGAAAATVGGIVLAQTTMLVALRRVMRYWPYDRQYLKPLIAGLLTIIVAFLAKTVLPLPAPGLAAIVILGPCLLVGFGVAILALGLSPSDKQLLGAFWRAVRSSGKGR